MSKLVQVALKVAHNNGVFTYRLPEAEKLRDVIGVRVKVSLRNRLLTGVIIGEAGDLDGETAFKIKDVSEIIDDRPVITSNQLALMKFCAKYYFNDLGACVHMAVPRNEKAPRTKSKKITKNEPVQAELSKEQTFAAHKILSNTTGGFLLEGVTGSGKTHVYIKVAEATLKEGKSVLFLVPEISLTPQLVHRVEAALGISALTMHSNITPQKKRDAIFELLYQEARVLIGARSAIFAPLKNLGLIVVDEEHDASLKQDEAPRYHARDLALWRAKHEGARVILGSATPSLESIVNAQKGKLTHLFLHDRFRQHRPLPLVSVIDLKERAEDVDFRTKDQSTSVGQKMCIISRPLLEEMRKTLLLGAQVLLFLNQRGYARFGVCHQCGQMVECPHCSVGLTYYQNRRSLLCHQCQYTEIAQTICRNCKQDAVRFLGLGTERLEEEVRALFPDHKTLRLDRDIVRSQRRLEDTLSAMHDRRADILIGTQMIAKGHDFMHVGLVGVVCADVALSMPDFRAAEKTFQLLTQVAGRAGRGHFAGTALIQTFNPHHPSIFYATTHNVKDFVEQELIARKRFLQPPFSRSALIRCEHSDAEVTERTISLARESLAKEKTLVILGPAPSPIERINNRYRFQCMVMANEARMLHGALERLSKNSALSAIIAAKRVRFIIDVDPQNLS